jgi:hypothetical protein
MIRVVKSEGQTETLYLEEALEALFSRLTIFFAAKIRFFAEFYVILYNKISERRE